MLKLNIGLSKKAGLPEYGSIGASCGLEVELNSTLLQHDPDGLQQQVRQAYAACAQAVNDELARQQSQGSPASNGPASNGNGQAANGNRRDPARKATASQVRALHAIAQRQQLDATNIVQSRYGVDKPEDLSITEASELIDSLKSQPNGTGGKR